jgi:hypothetical protein
MQPFRLYPMNVAVTTQEVLAASVLSLQKGLVNLEFS